MLACSITTVQLLKSHLLTGIPQEGEVFLPLISLSICLSSIYHLLPIYHLSSIVYHLLSRYHVSIIYYLFIYHLSSIVYLLSIYLSSTMYRIIYYLSIYLSVYLPISSIIMSVWTLRHVSDSQWITILFCNDFLARVVSCGPWEQFQDASCVLLPSQRYSLSTACLLSGTLRACLVCQGWQCGKVAF